MKWTTCSNQEWIGGKNIGANSLGSLAILDYLKVLLIVFIVM